MFTSTLNTDTQGVMGVTRGGQVSYHGDIIVVSFFYCDAITSSNILYGVTSGNWIYWPTGQHSQRVLGFNW